MTSPNDKEQQRNLLLDDCINRLGQEYLHEKLPNEADEAYDAAIGHCIGALRAMQGEYFPSSDGASEEKRTGAQAFFPDRLLYETSGNVILGLEAAKMGGLSEYELVILDAAINVLRGAEARLASRAERPDAAWRLIPNAAPQAVSGTKVNQPAQAVAGLSDGEPVLERPSPAVAAPKAQVWEQHPIRTLHACVETLAGAFKGYLPWPEERRDAVVRGHEMLIEDTIKRADACMAIIERAQSRHSASGATEASDKILELAMEAVATKHLEAPQDDEDRAYDLGVTDAYCAIKTLLSKFTGAKG